ncbi:hypothetical protein C8F04DRAFT_1211224 [Mycena alexandri]|uniref:CxC2-like cysteine cluster KDZ transposase-associated domain-containing protein n=1 Tax=Mycena alexandri TaxID=1745969 RepID=A0AAD6SR79_9AGAR|nr:hypothetical protein C8F04DRAFT_1211224 [Mycena alexandri]
MLVAALFASVVVTVRALELFRVLQLRCPRMGIQPFVRALCDIHGVAPRPYLSTQFSIAYDVYLAILANVDARVQAALGRDTPNWRLKNACPACMYKLEGEVPIPLPFLATIDGNNSLKQFWRREREEFDADGKSVPGASKERLDNRVAPGDYYLPRDEVDKWSKEGLEELMRGFVPGSEVEDEGEGCTEWWQNMKEDMMARAYGMYDETGIFPALCRHGFLLVVVDMVKSGELAKYGFAVTAHLLRDIGCKYGKMVRMHPALSGLAADNNFRSLVGAFHGHAHNRQCQLSNLATYVSGMGLEDLEGCEKYFSQSNGLAATTRYATAFHRQQAITTYMKHADTVGAYQGLSLLLASKYRRALKIKGTLPLLRQTMASMGVETRSVFETWLQKEKTYLASLKKEPAHETLQMEYYQKLTRRIETQRRHAAEVYVKTLDAVQDLEIRLGGGPRWVPEDREWVEAAAMLRNRRYQRALVIARMFELSKVNMSDTALQARSKGVKSALDTYNTAAAALSPPRTPLTWDQIVDYAFLSDFDLLREGREDIRDEPWAQPGGRLAMDQHFKLLRADEEITRLNLEIPRFITYMADEEAFLIHHEGRLRDNGNTVLAHQVWLQRWERGRFHALHMDRLVKLSKEPGFTVSLLRGVSMPAATSAPREDGGEEEEDGGDGDVDVVADALEHILRITA